MPAAIEIGILGPALDHVVLQHRVVRRAEQLLAIELLVQRKRRRVGRRQPCLERARRVGFGFHRGRGVVVELGVVLVDAKVCRLCRVALEEILEDLGRDLLERGVARSRRRPFRRRVPAAARASQHCHRRHRHRAPQPHAPNRHDRDLTVRATSRARRAAGRSSASPAYHAISHMRLRTIRVASVLAAAWISVAMQQPTDAFVDRLIAQMTLEEKISMLHGATDPETLRPGGVSAGRPEAGHSAAAADRRSGRRAHGPACDRAAGARRARGDVLAELAKRVRASASRRDARARHQDVILAPMVNIVRVPQGGRNFETLGEDPLLDEPTRRQPRSSAFRPKD